MKRSVYIIALIPLLILSRSYACSCGYGGSFVKMAAKTEFVALVKVSKYLSVVSGIEGKAIPVSMEVEIVDIYKGSETRKKITVWGDNGMLCRPYITSFKEGNYYIIAFQRAGFTGEKKEDYSISVCGSFWLNVDFTKHIAIGDIDNPDSSDKTNKTVTLFQLKNKIVSQ